MSSLNKARTSSVSLNVNRLSLAVIAMARLTLASMAADSGVLPGMTLVRSSRANVYVPLLAVGVSVRTRWRCLDFAGDDAALGWRRPQRLDNAALPGRVRSKRFSDFRPAWIGAEQLRLSRHPHGPTRPTVPAISPCSHVFSPIKSNSDVGDPNDAICHQRVPVVLAGPRHNATAKPERSARGLLRAEGIWRSDHAYWMSRRASLFAMAHGFMRFGSRATSGPRSPLERT